MISKTGTYIGNATNNRAITGLGFQPDIVIVKTGDSASWDTWFRTKDMPANFSLPVRADNGGDTSHIKSLDADGFTVSSDNAVNQSGYVIYWVAMKDDGTGDFSTVVFDGDNTDDKLVFTAFQPEYALLKSTQGVVGAAKFAAQPSAIGNQASNVATPSYQGTGHRPDLIGFFTDGMRVSNGSNSGGNLVNVSGQKTYGYVAKSSDTVKIGTYIGNGTGSKTIETGIQPIFMSMFATSGTSFALNSYAAEAAIGKAHFWDGNPYFWITGFTSTGYTVPGGDYVNQNAREYGYIVFKENTGYPKSETQVSNFSTAPSFISYATNMSVTAGQYVATVPGSGFAGFETAKTDITDSQYTIKVVGYDEDVTIGGMTNLYITSNGSEAFGVDISNFGSTVHVSVWANDNNYDVPTFTVSDDADITLGFYIRLREASGVLYAEYSTNGQAPWVVIGSCPTTSVFAGTNAKGVSLSGDFVNSGVSTISNAVILDDLNVVPTSPPVANFTASATTITAGQSITFTDTSTGSPTSWSWNFGDSTTSTSQNPTKTYTTAGTYTVTLTATNSGGSDGETKTGYITINAVPTTPTVMQTKTGNTSTNYVNSSTIALNGPVALNSTLVLVVATTASAANDITAVTDSLSNTWVKATSKFANGRSADIWYVTNSNAGTPTITIASGSYTQKSFGVTEIAATPNPLIIDGIGFTNDTGYVNTHTLTIPTTGVDDIIIGGYAGSAGNAVYTGENVITAGGDSVNAGMVVDVTGTNTITLGSDQYESGVFVGVAFLTQDVVLPNNIPDPSFESGIAGWLAYGAVSTQSATFARTGTKSLRLAPWEVWGGTYYMLPNASSASQQIFSAWVRGDGASIGKKVTLIIKNEDSGALTTSTQITLTSSWQQATITYTPSVVAQLSVQVQGIDLPSGSFVYIDDVAHNGSLEAPTGIAEFFDWKGYTWQRRNASTYGHVEPMFNGLWSRENIPDPTEDGLVLRLTNESGTSPVGAEIRTVNRDFGYGTYISVVNTSLNGMHPSIVFGGMFTFDENSPPAYDEIDVHETSAWGNTRPTDFDGVQLMHNMWRPTFDNTTRYVEDTWIDVPSQALQTHRLIWTEDSMIVDSFLGEGTDGTLIMHHEFDNVPVPSQTRIHYNLWVVGGGFEPANATPIDITVKDFSYTPVGNEVTTRDWHDYGVKPNKTIAELKQLAREKYDDWFAYTLTTDGMPSGLTNAKRIKVPDQGFYNNPEFNGTVSEGQGYGMLMKAWFSNPELGEGIYDPTAKQDFDKLFRYYDHFKNSNGLMHWNITYTGTVADSNGATDGDLDAAMALVIMSRLWPSDGAINYAAEATELINAIRDHEFVPATGVPGTGAYPNIITNGDGWGFATNNLMPDYFRPGFLREFYHHTADSRWLDIITANYTYAVQYYYDNYAGGMVPDRQTREHTSLGTDTDMVTYNSVRFGFGIMYDYLWNGPAAPALALNMMNKMANKAKANFTTGGNIKAPNYNLDFTTWQTYSNLAGYGLIGPATLGSTANQTFATEALDAMDASTEYASSYFNGGVGLMGLLAMTGIGQNYRGTPPLLSPVKRFNGTTWVDVAVSVL